MGRRLGQHFLHDPAILNRIVHALDPGPGDIVIEVGPGKGTLTRQLALQVGQVVAIETDLALAEALRAALREKSLPPNVQVVHGDALSVDWHGLLATCDRDDPRHSIPEFKVIGNVPYYITAPLIEKALQAPMPKVAVYLIQREVAERLAAAPGGKAYGALSVGVQLVAEVERLFTVRPGSFSPPPAVDSAVVRLTPLADQLVDSSERASFRRFVAAVFGQRRKQVSRALRTVTGLNKQEIDAMLSRLDIEHSDRPEVLTPVQFLMLFRTIDQQNGVNCQGEC